MVGVSVYRSYVGVYLLDTPFRTTRGPSVFNEHWVLFFSVQKLIVLESDTDLHVVKNQQ